MLIAKLKNWLDWSKWVEPDRLALASAIRTAAAALVPLIIAKLPGQAGFGLLMTLAGLNVSRTDPGGPYRAKVLARGSAPARPVTPTRQAILDFSMVSHVLKRLSQDVTGMYREQNQVGRG